jgi:hypothetical protein
LDDWIDWLKKITSKLMLKVCLNTIVMGACQTRFAYRLVLDNGRRSFRTSCATNNFEVESLQLSDSLRNAASLGMIATFAEVP